MPQLDKHDPHIADIFRMATLEREQQDQRLADIFGTQKVPKVTEEALAIYLAYLKQHHCHYAQGHLFGAAMSADAFLALMTAQSTGQHRIAALFA